MKNILLIGVGKFGEGLAKELANLGNTVMVLDSNEEKVHDILPFVSDAKIGDSTKEEVLKEIGVSNFDLVFVCVDSSFQTALLTTFLAKDLGAKYVIAKTDHPMNERFLLHNGADEVISPNKEIATKLAKKYSANHIFDYIELTPEYGVYEIEVPSDCINCSLRTTNFRSKYHVNVLAIKSSEDWDMSPSPDYEFQPADHLMILGKSADIHKFLKKKIR